MRHLISRLPFRAVLPLTLIIALPSCGDEAATPMETTGGAAAVAGAGGGVAGTPGVVAGSPATGSNWVAGSTYLLTVGEDDWFEPNGIGTEIGAYVPQFALSFTSEGTGSVGVRLGTGTGGVQEACSPTLEVTSGPDIYPAFTVGPVDLPLHLKYVDALGETKAVVHSTAYQLTMTGIMPDDGDPKNGLLSAVMDLREVYPMFQQLSANPTLESVKSALESFGDGTPIVSACPSDGAMECIALKADYLVAAAVQSPLNPVDPAIRADPSCTPTHVTP